MTTTTSYSKSSQFRSLYLETLRRSKGYIGLVSLLVFSFYPVQYIMEVIRSAQEAARYAEIYAADATLVQSWSTPDFIGLAENFTLISAIFFTGILLVVPFVLGLALNSYMHSKKAADVYHAIPVRREMLLGVNTAVGMSILAAPMVVSYVVVAVTQAVCYGFSASRLGWLAFDLLGWLIVAFMIYAVTAFVCVLSGTVFNSLVFSGVLLVAAPAISMLYLLLAEAFLYGFVVDGNIWATIMNLSPLLVMVERLTFPSGMNWLFGLGDAGEDLVAKNTIALLVYLVLGVLLLWASMKLYHRRRSEQAGTATSNGILPVIVKLVGTLLVGVTVGAMFYVVMGASSYAVYLCWTVIGGLLAYIVMEAVFNRGFKTMRRSLPLGIGMAVLSACFVAVFMYGGLGYETRVPALEKIESVELDFLPRDEYSAVLNVSMQPTTVHTTDGEQTMELQARGNRIDQLILKDPQNIETVLAFHQGVVTHPVGKEGYAYEGQTTSWRNRTITYHLKNGRTVSRAYNVCLQEVLLLLAPIETSEEYLTQANPAFFLDPEDVEEWGVQDAFGRNQSEQTPSDEEAQELLEAIREDTLDQTTESLLAPKEKVLAIVTFETQDIDELDGPRSRYAERGYFVVTNKGQRTWDFLEEQGAIDELEEADSDCIGVAVSMYDWSTSNDMPIVRDTPDNIYGDVPEEFDMLTASWDAYEKEKAKYPDGRNAAYDDLYYSREDQEATPDGRLLGERYSVRYISDDPQVIRTMLDAVSASCAIDDPYFIVSMYFADGKAPKQVLIPYSRLPQELVDEIQSQSAALQTYYGW